MAKRKINNEDSSTEIDFLSDLKKNLEKSGYEFSKYANIELKKETGIDAIDAILSSSLNNVGFQLRTFNILAGNTGAGKSTILTQIGSNFIKNNEGQLIYFDAEHTMSEERLLTLGCPKGRFLCINEDSTIENYHKLMKSLESLRLKQRDTKGEDYVFENPIVVILDSINTMYSITDVDIGTEVAKGLANNARAWTAIIKQHCDICRKYNITVLAVMQDRDNISMGPTPPAKDMFYGKSTKKFSGGKALKYAAFYFAELNSKKVINDVFGDQAVEVEFKMVKSKSSVANRPITLVFFPGTGYSNFHTNYKFMIDNNIIKAAGSYKELPGYEKKFYAKDVENLYKTDENFRLIFDKNVKDAYKSFISTVEKGNGIEEGSDMNFIADADLEFDPIHSDAFSDDL